MAKDFDSNGVEGMMHSCMNTMVNIVKIAASGAIMFTLSPWIVLAMFFLSFLHFIIIDQTKKIDKIKTWDALAPNWRKINYMDQITKNFNFAKDIRLFGLSEWLNKKQIHYHGEAHEKIVESKIRWIKCGLLNQIIGFIQEGLLYAWLIYSVLYNGVTIANVFLYFGAIRTFSETVSYTLDNIAEIRKQSMEINDFRTFVEYEEETHPTTTKPIPKGKDLEFVFDHVSFTYPRAKTFALEDLCLTLHAGKRLAVVGLNGAGKTTFIKLLCRLYEPTKGNILLNGINIKEYDLDEYYTLIAPVFQDVECFAFPISENVSMKPPQSTDIKLAETSLGLAGMEKKLTSLPTAALDALAEYKLYMDFDELIGNKDIKRMVTIVFVIIILNMLCNMLKNIITETLSIYADDFERYFKVKISYKTMRMDYEHTENPQALEQASRAETGMQWYSGGIAGLTSCFIEIIASIITLMGVMAILASSSPVLLAIIMICVILRTIINAKSNAINVKHFKALVSLNRSFGYVFWELSNFRFGKDIRLYGATSTWGS